MGEGDVKASMKDAAQLTNTSATANEATAKQLVKNLKNDVEGNAEAAIENTQDLEMQVAKLKTAQRLAKDQEKIAAGEIKDATKARDKLKKAGTEARAQMANATKTKQLAKDAAKVANEKLKQ